MRATSGASDSLTLVSGSIVDGGLEKGVKDFERDFFVSLAIGLLDFFIGEDHIRKPPKEPTHNGIFCAVCWEITVKDLIVEVTRNAGLQYNHFALRNPLKGVGYSGHGWNYRIINTSSKEE